MLERPDDHVRSYHLGEQSLLIDHHGNPFHQLLQLAGAAECCILRQDGCISYAMALAKRLNIKVVVC